MNAPIRVLRLDIAEIVRKPVTIKQRIDRVQSSIPGFAIGHKQRITVTNGAAST